MPPSGLSAGTCVMVWVGALIESPSGARRGAAPIFLPFAMWEFRITHSLQNFGSPGVHPELPRAALAWAQQHQGPCVRWTPALRGGHQPSTQQFGWLRREDVACCKGYGRDSWAGFHSFSWMRRGQDRPPNSPADLSGESPAVLTGRHRAAPSRLRLGFPRALSYAKGLAPFPSMAITSARG